MQQQQQQQRTQIIRMKYIENSIVFKKVQSTSNNMAAAVVVFLIKKDGCRRWQQIRQDKDKQQQQKQLIVQKQRQSSVLSRSIRQRTRHRKTLTESTLLCSTRMVEFDFDNIFDGSFCSTTYNEGGAFAEFIFDGDSEDELDDEQETSYWEGCQGS